MTETENEPLTFHRQFSYYDNKNQYAIVINMYIVSTITRNIVIKNPFDIFRQIKIQNKACP